MRLSRLLLPFVLLGILVACGDGTPQDADHRVLVRGNGGEPGTLDPVLAEDIHAFNILLDMYEGLFIEDAAGQLIPGVAASWRVSPDGMTHTFALRETARWSNGERVTAADFVRAARRAADPASGATYAFLLEPILNFAEVSTGGRPVTELGVRAVSDDVLEIRLEAPVGHLQAILALPVLYPMHASGDPGISNGPYVLGEREPGSTIRLVRNDRFRRNDSTYFDEVHYLPIADPQAEFNLYRTGKIDVTHNVPDDMVQLARASYPTQLRIAPSLALYYIALDLTEPPLDSPALRQALSMVVDREVITRLLGRGERPAFGVVPPGVAAYEPARYAWADEDLATRTATAQRLYTEAGYSAEKPLNITLMYDTEGVHEKIALAISAMWHDVLGANVNLDKREWNYFLDSRDRREDWDAMRFAWFGDYNSAKTFLDIFRSDSEQNLARYSSGRFDTLMSEADRSGNLESAAVTMREAESVLLADYAVIPVYFFVSKHMVADSIGGFEQNVVDRHASRWLYRQ